MDKDSSIFVAGHKGLVGSAIVRNLKANGYSNIVVKNRDEVDLSLQEEVRDFFYDYKPQYVFLAAAKVGGIVANRDYPADFIFENLSIQNNVIDAAYEFNCKKLLFLGSSCIYPKMCPQPIKEEYLLTGPLEPTNEAYAIAKIAGIKMCQAYRKQYGFDAISAMPTNLFGPGDNFDLETSHVLPALMRKMLDAAENDHESVTIWGDGTPKREFLYSDDLADACVFLMNNYSGSEPINVGTGKDISIMELAKHIARIVAFKGEIKTDPSKPNGTPRKVLDVTKLNDLGWKSKSSFETNIVSTLDWYLNNRK